MGQGNRLFSGITVNKGNENGYFLTSPSMNATNERHLAQDGLILETDFDLIFFTSFKISVIQLL